LNPAALEGLPPDRARRRWTSPRRGRGRARRSRGARCEGGCRQLGEIDLPRHPRTPAVRL